MARKFPDLPGMNIYDRQGKKISFEEYVELLTDKGWYQYRRVAWDSYGDFDVSTVWLGVDHNWMGDGDPIIFETIVFVRLSDQDDVSSVLCRRYRTEEDALAGHKEALEALHTPHVIEHTLEAITEEEADT